MNTSKIFLAMILFLMVQPLYAGPPTQDDFEATTEMSDEQGDGNFITGFERPQHEGPVTATDKIVDRFMQLNTNPESSAGVDYNEYFTMVQQRAQDRFKMMDANGDEEVTADEYREFWKAQKAQYYRLKR